MGSEVAEYPEEGPVHVASVDGFWMDETAVTVGEFRRFVKATGYTTVAERPLDPAQYPRFGPQQLVAGSIVFTPTPGPTDLSTWTNWWRFIAGASWARPQGPSVDTYGRDSHPVVHVCWEDVVAYAAWAGKEIPTEAEWEFAARGGLDGALYTWGEEFMPDGEPMANTWIGEFPWQNLKPPKQRRTTRVRSFPANGYGLYDMAGNVWEWTRDFYRADHGEIATHACCTPVNPRIDDPSGSYATAEEPGGAHVPRRVIKGGSHLCAENYCRRYRPAARQAQQVESSMSHIGFRCIVRA
jgi:formylglycine-generating enzyme